MATHVVLVFVLLRIGYGPVGLRVQKAQPACGYPRGRQGESWCAGAPADAAGQRHDGVWQRSTHAAAAAASEDGATPSSATAVPPAASAAATDASAASSTTAVAASQTIERSQGQRSCRSRWRRR